MKKRLVTTLLAGVMAASMVMPAFADSGIVPAADGTEVWAGIIIEDMDAKVKVEVPTLFAFVVKGATDGSANPVTTGNGDIYLPNFKVNVTTESTGGVGAVYELEEVGTLDVEGKLPFTNYSTYIDTVTNKREGLEVKINGNIKNDADAASRNYWEHTTSNNTTTADFKKYNISVDGNPFNTLADGGYEMADGLTLAAPDTDPLADGSYSNIDSDDHAIVGETYYAPFDVKVGGEKGEYNQVEQSAKIGKIIWTVSVEMQKDVDTAPSEDYLQP